MKKFFLRSIRILMIFSSLLVSLGQSFAVDKVIDSYDSQDHYKEIYQDDDPKLLAEDEIVVNTDIVGTFMAYKKVLGSAKMIDLGSGNSLILDVFKRNQIYNLINPGELISVDITDKSLIEGQRLYPEHAQYFLNQDITNLNLVSDNSMDYAVCTFGAVSYVGLGPVISETNRILKPNGSFYLMYYGPLREIAGEGYINQGKGYQKEYTYEQLTDTWVKGGKDLFKNVEVECFGPHMSKELYELPYKSQEDRINNIKNHILKSRAVYSKMKRPLDTKKCQYYIVKGQKR